MSSFGPNHHAASCWVQIDAEGNSGTPTAKDSFNVSSLSDNAFATTTVNINNNMSNANYAVVMGSNSQSDARELNATCLDYQQNAGGTAPATGSVKTKNYAGATSSANATEQDPSRSSVVIFGDI